LETKEQFDLVLADIYIPAAATEINQYNITDMRDSPLCGYIGVKGAVSQLEFDRHLADYVSRLRNIRVLQFSGGSTGLVIDRDLEDGIYVLLIGRDNGMYLISVFEGNGSIGDIFPVSTGGAFSIQINGTKLQVNFGTRHRSYVLLRVL